MTLSRPVNDFAFIEQETIILGARNVLLRAAGSPMSLVGEWGALQVLLVYVVIVVVNNNPFVV